MTEQSGLARLPPELFEMITEYLEIRHMRELMVTSRDCNKLVQPAFYRRLYIGSHWDEKCSLSNILSLLARKADILPYIRTIIFEELDERCYRELLALPMPNLQNIILRHQGPFTETQTEEEKQLLNLKVLPKPRLENRELMSQASKILH